MDPAIYMSGPDIYTGQPRHVWYMLQRCGGPNANIELLLAAKGSSIPLATGVRVPLVKQRNYLFPLYAKQGFAHVKGFTPNLLNHFGNLARPLMN
jgi:hypothetical protein